MATTGLAARGLVAAGKRSALVLALVALSACGGDRRGSTDGGSSADASGPIDSDAGVMAVIPNTDPICVDGLYREGVPSTDSDVSDVLAAYASGAEDEEATIIELLNRRYPLGAEIVREALLDTSLNCVTAFVGDPISVDDLVSRLSTVVHECGHVVDLNRSAVGQDEFFVRDDVAFRCDAGDTTARGGMTFERSRLMSDGIGSAWPPCAPGASGGCDAYANVYLDGNPDDTVFESGDQGFNSLLEETTQYINSLATGYAFHDQYTFVISERDGLLTFLWYLGRYLRLARTEYPDAYAHLTASDCWRRAILTVWGRAWLYLDVSSALGGASGGVLGFDDAEILPLAAEPMMLEEIQRVRDAHGCGGS